MQYNRVYNEEEYYKRLQIFTENKRRIEKHNEGNHSFTSKQGLGLSLSFFFSILKWSNWHELISYFCSESEPVFRHDFWGIQKDVSLVWATGKNVNKVVRLDFCQRCRTNFFFFFSSCRTALQPEETTGAATSFYQILLTGGRKETTWRTWKIRWRLLRLL